MNRSGFDDDVSDFSVDIETRRGGLPRGGGGRDFAISSRSICSSFWEVLSKYADRRFRIVGLIVRLLLLEDLLI